MKIRREYQWIQWIKIIPSLLDSLTLIVLSSKIIHLHMSKWSTELNSKISIKPCKTLWLLSFIFLLSLVTITLKPLTKIWITFPTLIVKRDIIKDIITTLNPEDVVITLLGSTTMMASKTGKIDTKEVEEMTINITFQTNKGIMTLKISDSNNFIYIYLIYWLFRSFRKSCFLIQNIIANDIYYLIHINSKF